MVQYETETKTGAETVKKLLVALFQNYNVRKSCNTNMS